MKVYMVSMLNAFVLMILGLWGYLGSEDPSLTALIPVILGALLLSLTQQLRYGSKPMAHLSVIITLLILIGLIKPLSGAIMRADSNAIYRVSAMMVSCAIATGFFVRSFIMVRKRKKKLKFNDVKASNG